MTLSWRRMGASAETPYTWCDLAILLDQPCGSAAVLIMQRREA
jgi:hypothetical protein